MTHEELLAKIDGILEEAGENLSAVIFYKALRAVVELHKPNEEGWCVECSLTQNHYIAYPCPTIQAIEKELK